MIYASRIGVSKIGASEFTLPRITSASRLPMRLSATVQRSLDPENLGSRATDQEITLQELVPFWSRRCFAGERR